MSLLIQNYYKKYKKRERGKSSGIKEREKLEEAKRKRGEENKKKREKREQEWKEEEGKREEGEREEKEKKKIEEEKRKEKKGKKIKRINIVRKAATLAMEIEFCPLSEIKIEIEKMRLCFLKKDLTNIEKMLENSFLKSYQKNALIAKKWKIIDKINLLTRDLIFYLSLFRVFVYNGNRSYF